MKFVPLYLTYDNEIIQDGVGAQIMRIIAIRAISQHFKLGYLHTGVKNLTVTQLDPFQNQQEIDQYIFSLNEIFKLASVNINNAKEEYQIYNLTRKDLLIYGLRAMLLRKKILLKITIPFYITNRYPKALKNVSKLLPDFRLNQTQDKRKVVIHFRAGADPKHIDPGKSEARFIPIDYFDDIVSKIRKQNPNLEFEVCLLTDAPPQAIHYSPLAEQLEKWKETGYKIENGSIEIKPLDLKASNLQRIPGFRVIHGGDPVEAVREMASADYLLMSRSTLSYLGAILNKSGTIIYPPRFGATPLRGWIAGENY